MNTSWKPRNFMFETSEIFIVFGRDGFLLFVAVKKNIFKK